MNVPHYLTAQLRDATRAAGYYAYFDFAYAGTPLMIQLGGINSYVQFSIITCQSIALLIILKKQVGETAK